jgi:transposase-like protein
MTIVLHLGDTIKSYRQRFRTWWPARCPGCGGARLRAHDVYSHGAEPGAEPVSIQRFRCRGRGCQQRVSLLPDVLLPRCSYPAAVRDRAVAAYVNGRGTYEEIAAEIGVSKSTVWRWVHEAVERSERWLAVTRAELRRLGEPDGPVVFRHDLRVLFIRRRVRRPGMLDGLLIVEALLGWVARLRQALLDHRLGPLPGGLFAFGRHVLDRLQPPSRLDAL